MINPKLDMKTEADEWKNICETLVSTYLKMVEEQQTGSILSANLAKDIFIEELNRTMEDLGIVYKKEEEAIEPK